MFFENNDLHKKMAGAQDLDGDGVISPQEAAAYIQQYIQSAPPEDRARLMQDYFGQMPAEQKSALGTALVQSPATPVSSVRPGDDHDLIDAYTKSAQAPAQNGKSPLEAAFGQGGMLGNPLVKAGLVGLAGMIGSRLLRR
ncbi:hypothetical protein [Deinococcus sp.]|uniref:hypothetical protein n=1 Tax=Deinococcus sp. TaxID=47478 RepID=UPI00286DB771|nr:hypothetical protein [Deinococcus sp.]